MKKENQKLYHFYGGWTTRGHFFVHKRNWDEKIFSFGFGRCGELANKESVENISTPKIANNIPNIGKVSKIAKGTFHTLFLMSPKEDVYGIGVSQHGALSVKLKKVLSPILVTSEALKGVRIGDIACSWSCSILLSKNGVPYACGYNEDGQCGVGTKSNNIYSAIPMKIKGKVIQIECGHRFTVLLTNKRDIYKTGIIHNEMNVIVPTKLVLNEKAKFFRAGKAHLLVVGMSGQLYGMGYNFYNQLTSHIKCDFISHLSVHEFEILTKITSLKGKIKDIKCSFYDSYALMENNDLYGWGRNNFGQSKGNGTVSEDYPWNPTPFLMKSNVEQIEVGAYSCFVFCKEGVYVCGKNEYDDLGMGNTTDLSTLTLNKNLKNFKRIVKKLLIPQFDPKMKIFDIIIKNC